MRRAAEDSVDDRARSWEEKLRATDPGEDVRPERGTGSIFRVPESIRATDPSAYEPKIVSIGPYHRDKPHLKPMDQVKLLYLKRILRRNPRAGLKDYLQLVNGLVARSRSCYAAEEAITGMSAEEFSDMLLLDGCFIIELLLANHAASRGEQTRGNDPILGNTLTLSLVEYDVLLLVENQLPFFVLESLFNLVAVSDEENSLSLVDLAIDFSTCHLPPKCSLQQPAATNFYHLLHLFHSCVAADGVEPESIPFNLTRHTEVPRIPCATDLMHAQVELRRKTDGNSYTMSFGQQRVLKIAPGRQLDSGSSCLYRNLIAFEQHFFGEVKGQITAYTMFMGCLIDSEKDLTLLRQHRLIEYTTLDSQESALFFRKLCRDAIRDYDKMYCSHLMDISEKVWEYYGKRWTQWAALFRRIYFPDPKDAVNLFYGVILVVFLTALQTFYTVYAYYRPPK